MRIVMMPIRKKPSTTAILLTGMFFCSLPIALLFAVNLLGFDVEYTPRSWCGAAIVLFLFWLSLSIFAGRRGG